MKIRVRNSITGKEYQCREEDFIRAKKKGAALVRLGVVKEVEPSFLKEEIDEEPKKTARKTTPRKKAGEKNNQNDN